MRYLGQRITYYTLPDESNNDFFYKRAFCNLVKEVEEGSAVPSNSRSYYVTPFPPNPYKSVVYETMICC